MLNITQKLNLKTSRETEGWSQGWMERQRERWADLIYRTLLAMVRGPINYLSAFAWN